MEREDIRESSNVVLLGELSLVGLGMIQSGARESRYEYVVLMVLYLLNVELQACAVDQG